MFNRDLKTARMGHEILPFEMGYLPEFFQRKAKVELNDTPENRQRCLEILRERMANDSNFKDTTFDEDFLLQYLRCKKFNINKALHQLKAFVNFRKKYPNLFKDFYFERIAYCTRTKAATFLPYRCQDGCIIALINLDIWDPERFPVDEVRRMAVIYVLQALRDPMTQVNGFKAIFDVKSNPARHIRHVTPTNMYLLYYGILECSPGRFKGVHIVNNSLTFKVAYTLVRTFLPSKIRSRIHFHSTPETLLDFFPASVLPVEYGGELADYDMTGWLKDVMSPEKLATIGGGNSLVK